MSARLTILCALALGLFSCDLLPGDPVDSRETITFSRDGAWLVMEGTNPEHGAMKFFFKKDPGKL